MDDSEEIAKPQRVRLSRTESDRQFQERLERLVVNLKESEQLSAMAERKRDSSSGGGLERVIAELKGALRAAEQAQDSEANVDGLRSHAAQHAQQAWLLLTGSVPDRIWGRCDCAL